ncbi:MAG: PVC-type heme-binding CxxCH protein [Planctomycetota bacterium]
MIEDGQKIAVVGNSLGERMNLFGHFETQLHLHYADKKIRFRNFSWPADEVGIQQRPSSYTKIDDPMKVFAPELYLCFFGANESYAGTTPEALSDFKQRYREYIERVNAEYSGGKARFVLISPIAFESTGDPLHPNADERNSALEAYKNAIKELAAELQFPFVNVFDETRKEFAKAPGAQYTINGLHLNERGDQTLASLLNERLFNDSKSSSEKAPPETYARVRHWVNDKSWLHLQDYRMLNGWYVYGGRRTWDTETFPSEYRKIREMVTVRDQYIWDIAAGKEVAAEPDDSNTGDVVVPPTMFGTRDDNFRRMREPKELVYPTPEESIGMMTVPNGMEVKLFASEREFPELANPNQIAFDAKGRLWVSCMPNYPQWQPGAAPPSDRLLILEDTDGDEKADKCTTFYDKLICPTGFEFHDGGVLVVDEPRILFLKDTDGDDQADEIVNLIDGIATDDTHHTVGAWEWSHGGMLHMLEGIALSTTMETPWGPFRNKGTGGAYVFDPKMQRFSHYRTPGYGNPWCLVFDEWGNGIVGDGTNAKQHWISPLAGKEVSTRKTLEPVFNNEGMRPAVGNEFLLSRHLPDEVQGQFIYACVINMHGMPRFNLRYQDDGAGYEGERVADLLSSSDMIFRPVDPKVGPDGAIWFGDWCNALIGHMQYSQRDPNRDHTHGRVYRLVNKDKPLLPVVDLTTKSEAELLEYLMVPELRTRYRVRRELGEREKTSVFAAIKSWLGQTSDARELCEAMWVQERFRDLNPKLIDRVLASEDYRARAAAIHTITNQIHLLGAGGQAYLATGIKDPHPRVRLEAVRGVSFLESPDATTLALSVVESPMDYWLHYTLEHTLHALEPMWRDQEKRNTFLASSSEKAKNYFKRYKQMSGPGGAAVVPLEIADDVDAKEQDRYAAIRQLAGIRGGNGDRGEAVFKQVCSACHQVGDLGKKFGPELTDIGSRMNTEQIIKTIVMPNAEISKGYETVSVLTAEGDVHNGFVLAKTDDTLSLGIANGKRVDIAIDDIELQKEMKASSMPEGLVKQIAPIEFLDLVAYLSQQRNVRQVKRDGWYSLQYRDPPQLRTHAGASEISRDASIRLGQRFGNNSWNSQASATLGPVGHPFNDFSFHSDHDVQSPEITLRLTGTKSIKHLWLKNRVSSQFHSRAQGLTVWISDDDKEYREVWSAKEMKGEWMIDLPAGTTAKYVKVGLNGKGTFHLYQIAVYGE